MVRPDAGWFLSKLPLAVILLSAAALRFYDLGALPLTGDEILVPMAARHSLAYIFNLCATQETHPPLFYFITKAVLLVSSSDAAVRSVSVFSGIVSIYLIYRIAREFIDEETGLLAAAFLSINVLYFLLSQAVRPYSFQTTLFLVAFWLIARLVKKGQWNDLILLCVANVLLFLLHYFAYYMVAAQGAVLGLGLFIKSSPFTRRQFAVFCLFTVLAAVPIYIRFALPSLACQLSSAHLPRQTMLRIISQDLWIASIFVSSEFHGAGLMYLGPLAGWLICLWRKPKFAMLCLLAGGVPLALVLAMAPGYPLRIWHVVWLTPILSLCAAMLLSWLPSRDAGRFSLRRCLRLLAPLLAVAGSVFILIHRHDMDLGEFSSRTDLRTTAQRLAPLLSDGALTSEAPSSSFFNVLAFNTMSWYLDQSPPNPLATQHLEPGNGPVALHLISGRIRKDEPAGEADAYVRMAMGELGKITQAPDATVYTFQLDRQATVIDALPATFVFPAGPKGFYSHVSRLHNVRSVPGYVIPPLFPILKEFRVLDGGVIATLNNQPVFFEFVLENTLGDKPMHFFADLQSVNIGAGNRIRLLARFDDEPSLPLAERTGPDPDRSLVVNFSRNAPFKRLTFIVEMYCKDDTALLFGDNLRTLVFQGLEVDLVKASAPSGAIEEAVPHVR